LKSYLKNQVSNLKALFQGKSYIQLFSKEGNKTVINASSIIVTDYPPVFKSCVESGFKNSYKCFKDNLKSFIINNLYYNIIENENLVGELRIHINFQIGKEGEIFSKKISCYSPNIYKNGKLFNLKLFSYSENLKKEIERILNKFKNQVLEPATRNSIPFVSKSGGDISIIFEENLNDDDLSNLSRSSYTNIFKGLLTQREINLEKYKTKFPTKLFLITMIQGN